MMIRILICLFVSSLFAHASAAVRPWTDVEGRVIRAEYISHSAESVKLRLDGRIYNIEIIRLSEVDRAHLGALDVPQAKEPATPGIFTDSSLLEYDDPKGDISSKYDDPQLDITEVSFKKNSGSHFTVTMTFSEAFPLKAEKEGPYRVWLKLDLDDDATTGSSDDGMGVDLAITLFGDDARDKWETYSVPKSKLRKEAKVEVRGIKATENQLVFSLKGTSIRSTTQYSLKLVSLLNGRVVDHFPDYAAEPLRLWSKGNLDGEN